MKMAAVFAPAFPNISRESLDFHRLRVGKYPSYHHRDTRLPRRTRPFGVSPSPSVDVSVMARRSAGCGLSRGKSDGAPVFTRPNGTRRIERARACSDHFFNGAILMHRAHRDCDADANHNCRRKRPDAEPILAVFHHLPFKLPSRRKLP